MRRVRECAMNLHRNHFATAKREFRRMRIVPSPRSGPSCVLGGCRCIQFAYTVDSRCWQHETTNARMGAGTWTARAAQRSRKTAWARRVSICKHTLIRDARTQYKIQNTRNLCLNLFASCMHSSSRPLIFIPGRKMRPSGTQTDTDTRALRCLLSFVERLCRAYFPS